MKNRAKIPVILIIISIATVTLFADGTQPSGAGTESDPYLISTFDHLRWVSTNASSWNSYFEQTCDISAAASHTIPFSPIGTLSIKFTGSYDGGGYTIDDLFINQLDSNYVGLFGHTYSGATIQNLGVTNVNISATQYVGALVGYHKNSDIANCYSTGNVYGYSFVGGLVGMNYNCTLSESYSTCTVQPATSDSTVSFVGGLVGSNASSAMVSNSYSTGTVQGKSSVGGLLGVNNGSNVDKSYSKAYVSGTGFDIGGVVGFNTGTITNSFWDTETSGELTGQDDGVGNQTRAESGVYGKTTFEMKNVSTFTDETNAGLTTVWDFANNPNDDNANNDYWDLDSSETNPVNNGYPFLCWQTEADTLCQPYGNFVWSIRFGARVGDAVDLNNYIGVIARADNSTTDPYDVPEPPHTPNNYIQLDFNGNLSVAAYDTCWFEQNVTVITLNLDTDLDRNQPLELEIEIGDTTETQIAIQTKSYKYSFYTKFDSYISMQGNGFGTYDFPVIPDYIYFVVGYLDTTHVHFSTFQDPINYFLGNKNLTIGIYTENLISGDHVIYFYYKSNDSNSWQFIGNSNEPGTISYVWYDPPMLGKGIIRATVYPYDYIGYAGNLSWKDSNPIVFTDNYTPINEGWNFISVPHSQGEGNLDEKLWLDNVPDYWLFNYVNTDGWSQVKDVELPKGYAIYVDSADAFGYYLDSDTTVTQSLEIGSGWNLLGSPNNFSKSLSDAQLIHHSDLNDTLSFGDAVDSGYVFNTVYDYGENSNYTTTTTLAPWKSYWLASMRDSLTLIYPSQPQASDRIQENEWRVALNFTHNEIITSAIELGVNSQAENGFDPVYDFPKPPPFPEKGYLNTFFMNESWGDLFGGRFMTDIRKTDYDQVWTIDGLNQPEDAVIISWNQETIPDTIQLILQAGSDSISMNQNSSYAMQTGTSFPLHITSHRMAVSNQSNINLIPCDFELFQNFPNPFNPITIIKYSIPVKSHVTISVYDLQGHLISKLINQNQQHGYYKIQWDGSDVSSGIYFYQIQAGSYVKTHKMVLMK